MFVDVLCTEMYRGLKDPKTTTSILAARKKDRNSLSDSVSHNLSADVVGSPKLDKKHIKSLEKCPCRKSDPASWLLKCTACKQHWHSTCANLCGISKEFVECIENWKCPLCFVPCTSNKSSVNPYICSVCNNSQKIKSALDDQSVEKFLESVSNIVKQNEELSKSANDIEYFNLHLKHLLLDKSEFEDLSDKMSKFGNNISDINGKIDNLQSEISQMSSQSTPNPDSTIEEITTQINKISETIN